MKVDKYGIADLGRAHDLSSTERFAMLCLALGADFRTWKWSGTLSELAEVTGMSRRTIPPVLDRLWELDLVVTVKPFGRGVHGVLFVAAYGELVVREKNAGTAPVAQNCANPRPSDRAVIAQTYASDRADFAQGSRSGRAVVARNCAKSVPVTCDDATSRGSEAARERGSEAEPRDNARVLEREHEVLLEQERANAIAAHEKNLGAAVENVAFCRNGCGDPANGDDGYCKPCERF